MAARDFSFARDIIWLTSMVLCAEAAGMLGDTDSARTLYEELLPYEDQVISTRAHCIGPVGYYIAKAAAALGRPEAADHYRSAIARCETLRSPFHKARAMLGLAELLRSEQPAEAARFAREAAELAERYSMPLLADQAAHLTS